MTQIDQKLIQIDFDLLPWSDGLPGTLLPLLRNHYQEIARYKDIPLNPDFNMYRIAAQQGMLRIFVMFDYDVIVGYNIFFVKHNPHYMDSLQAVQDILYIEPYMRKGTNGIRFIRWCDDQLRDEGVQMVMHHVKVYKDFSRILERMGYEEVDKIYVKRLDIESNRQQHAKRLDVQHGNQRISVGHDGDRSRRSSDRSRGSEEIGTEAAVSICG